MGSGRPLAAEAPVVGSSRAAASATLAANPASAAIFGLLIGRTAATVPRCRRGASVEMPIGATYSLDMPRIRPLSIDEAAPELRPGLEQAARALGEPLVPSGIQARCPAIFEASRALGAAPARSGKLPALIRALVCLRAAQLAGCPF